MIKQRNLEGALKRAQKPLVRHVPSFPQAVFDEPAPTAIEIVVGAVRERSLLRP